MQKYKILSEENKDFHNTGLDNDFLNMTYKHKQLKK